MTPEERLLSINYLNVLSALEQACRGERDDPIQDGERKRVRDYGKSLLNFVMKAIRQRDKELAHLSDALGIAAKGIRDKESKLLRSIAKATSPDKGFSGEETVTSFPGKIPPKEVVGRLVATVLGLHAENRHDPNVPDRVRESLERAVENILSPALAWNLLVDVSREHPSHQADILSAAQEAVRLAGVGKDYAAVGWAKGKTTLPSLLVYRAWATLLRKEFGLEEPKIRALLAEPVAKALEGRDLPTTRERLHPKVTEAFGWGEHASERTLAVALANQSGKSAARVDRRIELLKAASSREAREWSALLQQDPAKALGAIKGEIQDRALSTLQAAGKAFWLSRHCFRRASGGGFFENAKGEWRKKDLDATVCDQLEKASELVLGLMELAATQPNATKEQVLLLRRFQAGFSTNPRYWRAPAVLESAERLVAAYEGLVGHKAGLVAHFKARLALQDWYSQQAKQRPMREVPVEALRAYHRVFELSPSLTELIDAEAPIHLFPEVIVLLTFGSDGGSKVSKALEDVDLILKCNFGVYLDIEDEKAAILGGLEQAKAWSARTASKARLSA